MQNSTPDLADVLAAGREYPVRDFRVAVTPTSARTLLRAIHAFWIAAAEGYLALAEAGCPESARDADRAMRAAAPYAPAAA